MDIDAAKGSRDRVRAAVEATYGAYEVVEPGMPSFICAADACQAQCCRTLTVPADDRDAAAISDRAGVPRSSFLESENGVPLELPLSQPYLMARSSGKCVFLNDDARCGVYESRPAACRSYPFELAILDAQTGRETAASGRAALRALAGGTGVTVILIRHRECPGFTGPPLTPDTWRSTVRELIAARYSRTEVEIRSGNEESADRR